MKTRNYKTRSFKSLTSKATQNRLVRELISLDNAMSALGGDMINAADHLMTRGVERGDYRFEEQGLKLHDLDATLCEAQESIAAIIIDVGNAFRAVRGEKPAPRRGKGRAGR